MRNTGWWSCFACFSCYSLGGELAAPCSTLLWFHEPRLWRVTVKGELHHRCHGHWRGMTPPTSANAPELRNLSHSPIPVTLWVSQSRAESACRLLSLLTHTEQEAWNWAEAICLPTAPTFLSPPSRYSWKHVPLRFSLAYYQGQSNQGRIKLRSSAFFYTSHPNLSRWGLEFICRYKWKTQLSENDFYILPVPYNYLRYNCVYALDLCWSLSCFVVVVF